MEAATKLTHRGHLHLVKDYARTASVAKLVYVNDSEPGISRVRKGSGFAYAFKDKTVKTKDEIARINKLAIPPAWENVWTCGSCASHAGRRRLQPALTSSRFSQT